MCDLLWIVWHWDTVFSQYFSFPYHCHSIIVPYSFICHWHHLILAVNIVIRKHKHTHTKCMKHGLLSATEEVYDIFRDGGVFLLLYHLIKEAETS